jgi:hypothetical protein
MTMALETIARVYKQWLMVLDKHFADSNSSIFSGRQVVIILPALKITHNTRQIIATKL